MKLCKHCNKFLLWRRAIYCPRCGEKFAIKYRKPRKPLTEAQGTAAVIAVIALLVFACCAGFLKNDSDKHYDTLSNLQDWATVYESLDSVGTYANRVEIVKNYQAEHTKLNISSKGVAPLLRKFYNTQGYTFTDEFTVQVFDTIYPYISDTPDQDTINDIVKCFNEPNKVRVTNQLLKIDKNEH